MMAIVLALLHGDTRVDDLFYDFGNHRWRFQDNWWINTLIHSGGKELILIIGLGSLCTWLASFRWSKARAWRRESALVWLCIALTTGSVALGKKLSNQDCPWDLARYGGDRPYVALWNSRPGQLPRGRCFPGGHSSGAFALDALFFVFRARGRTRLAVGSLVGTTALGLTYAVGQWMRGAHFPSHDLWSAIIAWEYAVALNYLIFFRRQGKDGVP
ncbi:MAG: phosphatase PAP2 family protein [Magnetococcales bacterium]|nr:phosphatase PAP2 family protein [Magnetococcales bacterium]MBF0155559.1 phosphatase PAP2 family protein [Magnetococcales bacterium]